MKQYSILSGVLFFCSTAFGAACLPGTLQDYVNLGASGCQNGNVIFSSFTSAPGQFGAIPIGLSQVAVLPGGSAFFSNLQFTINQTATSGQLLESFFRFKAAGPSLVAATVNINSPFVTNDGANIASLDICPGAMFSGNSPSGCPASQSAISLETVGFSMLSDSKMFTASSFFDVFADLTADGGSGGSARFGSASVTINSTPEPATTLLVLGGLTMLALTKRVKRNLSEEIK